MPDVVQETLKQDTPTFLLNKSLSNIVADGLGNYSLSFGFSDNLIYQGIVHVAD